MCWRQHRPFPRLCQLRRLLEALLELRGFLNSSAVHAVGAHVRLGVRGSWLLTRARANLNLGAAAPGSSGLCGTEEVRKLSLLVGQPPNLLLHRRVSAPPLAGVMPRRVELSVEAVGLRLQPPDERVVGHDLGIEDFGVIGGCSHAPVRGLGSLRCLCSLRLGILTRRARHRHGGL